MAASYLKPARRAGSLVGIALWLIVVGLASVAPADAQYFGRNKVQYRTFDTRVLETEHFDLYYYPEETEAAQIVGRMAERWHARLSRFFGHDLRGRQPLILYASAAHFQQTNAIEGLIGEGTGGVTEPMKRRVVLPMGGSLADTDHVLGHELVHAFQFDLTGSDPRDRSGDLPGILDYPLWFVEGMAEYLSLGPVDPQTSMWLRDAALHEKLPTIRELDDPKYFPYRWGHAFWAYVGAKYGDRMVASLIRSAANPRYDLEGLARQLGTNSQALTNEWHEAIRSSAQLVAEAAPPITSEPVLAISEARGGGRFNVGPQVSPDGKQVVFFSERDLFSVELYLADLESGEIVRKLLKSATDPHFDSLEFLNSAGAWSPDGRTLALAAVRGGRPVLAFIDPRSGGVRRELPLVLESQNGDGKVVRTDLDDALNPVYAPDGRSIVFSGNAGGLLDLYRVTLATGRVEQLTNDPFADLEPTFTPDGRSLVFTTERFSTDLTTLEAGPLRLARLDLATKEVRQISAFLRGKHLSPQVSADGTMVTFIANPDGVSNLYRIGIDGGPIERLSSVPTGIAGITTTSPALSVSSASGRLVFSVFDNGGHAIYILDPAKIVATVAPPADFEAAVLPGRTVPGGDVHGLLADAARGLPTLAASTAASAASASYGHKLSLDALGQPTVSANVNSFGTSVGGGMSAFFSDMLGDRALGVSGEIAGSVADIGAQLIYVNRRHRWNWAAGASVTPYRIGYLSRKDDPGTGETVITETIARQPSRGVFGLTAYPFNASTRMEFSATAQSLAFTRELHISTYDTASRRLLGRETQHLDDAPSLYLGQVSAAFVHDSSYFGATSPLYGKRYRVEIGQTHGSLDLTTALVDWRRYYMPKRPFTIAVRALHYGRYGRNSEDDQLVPLYAGYPEFVHGYGVGSFSAAECLEGVAGQDCDVFRSLIGSRMVVANIEVHAPLRGLFSGTLDYGRVPIDVAAFTDAGVTWTSTERPAFAGGSRHLVRSVGGAIRVNMLGLFAVELSAAHPFDRPNGGLRWQVGIRQGF